MSNEFKAISLADFFEEIRRDEQAKSQVRDSRIAKPGYRHALARRENLRKEKQNRKSKSGKPVLTLV